VAAKFSSTRQITYLPNQLRAGVVPNAEPGLWLRVRFNQAKDKADFIFGKSVNVINHNEYRSR
jgi:hypothetical protein